MESPSRIFSLSPMNSNWPTADSSLPSSSALDSAWPYLEPPSQSIEAFFAGQEDSGDSFFSPEGNLARADLPSIPYGQAALEDEETSLAGGFEEA